MKDPLSDLVADFEGDRLGSDGVTKSDSSSTMALSEVLVRCVSRIWRCIGSLEPDDSIWVWTGGSLRRWFFDWLEPGGTDWVWIDGS